jgi:DNA-binding NtrC family response regulator
VLQARKVRPVGGDEEFSIAARILASTNRDLEHAVRHKQFREDLYYRLNVVTLDVPPLNARESDVLLLAQHFIRRIAERSGKPVIGFTAPVAQLLGSHDWPGNVRELENVIERASALCQLDHITVADLPETLCRPPAAFVLPGADIGDLVTLAEMRRRYVRRVVSETDGNKAMAARLLGIDRRSLYRRLGDEE